MTEHAVLGPVDPQVGGYPAASVLSVLARKATENIDDETLIIADVAQRAMQQLRASITDLLADRSDRERAEQIAALFTESEWTHDRPVTVTDLRGLGFSINTDMPGEILELMSLYRAPTRGARNVEYLGR